MGRMKIEKRSRGNEGAGTVILPFGSSGAGVAGRAEHRDGLKDDASVVERRNGLLRKRGELGACRAFLTPSEMWKASVDDIWQRWVICEETER